MSRRPLPAFRFLLWLYPGEFRDEYDREMTRVLSDRYRAATTFWERASILLEALTGVLLHAPQEHFFMMLRDLRYAVRLLLKSPSFTLTAVLSLAIGIGANTSIFAVAKMVLFDTLPVKDPRQLRMLTWESSGPDQPVPPVWGDVSRTKEGGLASTAFSYPVLREFRKKQEVFQDLIAFKDVEMTATVDGHPELITSEMLSGGALGALGVQPILGRTLSEADDNGTSAAASPFAVISEDYWNEKFGRSAAVLGKIISLNGSPVTIVGVTPARFTGLTMGNTARVFVPLSLQPLLVPRAQKIGAGGASLLDNPESWWVVVLARLRKDVPETETQAALDVVLRQTAKATLPEAKHLDQFHLKLRSGDRGLDYLAGFAEPSYILLALAGLVLLLACVNLANLLLARAAGRRREMSTRIALGAGRAIILRQLLTESLLLSALGGLAGLALGFVGRNLLSGLLADSWHRAGVKADFDWGVVSFAVAISLLTSLVFGAVPIWQAMRTDVNSALKEARQKVRVGQGLVVLQIALSTVLLIAAGLFVRTLLNLSFTPVGFPTDHLLVFKLNPPRTRYTDAQMLRLYANIEERFAAIAGVRSVTLSNIALIGDGHSGSSFEVSGQPVDPNAERVQTNGVGETFFSTMGIPILAGRGFDTHDDARSMKVAVVNRALVRRFFPRENPIGKAFRYEDADVPVQIVGVAADTRYADLRSDTPPTFYVPYRQRDYSSRMIFELRTKSEPFSVLGQARAVVESLDRDLPLVDIRTEDEQIKASLSSERTFAELTSGFGLLALVLAGVGVYGLMAYTVARRTAEIGIRMALGARDEQVLTAVLREAIWMALIGVSAGIGVSSLLAQFVVGSMLYGLKTTDPLTISATTALMMCITALAAFGPARRASRVDPVGALRHE